MIIGTIPVFLYASTKCGGWNPFCDTILEIVEHMGAGAAKPWANWRSKTLLLPSPGVLGHASLHGLTKYTFTLVPKDVMA